MFTLQIKFSFVISYAHLCCYLITIMRPINIYGFFCECVCVCVNTLLGFAVNVKLQSLSHLLYFVCACACVLNYRSRVSCVGVRPPSASHHRDSRALLQIPGSYLNTQNIDSCRFCSFVFLQLITPVFLFLQFHNLARPFSWLCPGTLLPGLTSFWIPSPNLSLNPISTASPLIKQVYEQNHSLLILSPDMCSALGFTTSLTSHYHCAVCVWAALCM